MRYDENILKQYAREIRITTIRMIGAIGKGHVGGSLDLAELMAVLYYEVMNIDPQNCRKPDRDRLVLSKGHAGPVLYSTLALKGFFPMSWINSLNAPGTNLPSHCDMQRTPGVDMTTGSLGQGLSAATGMALAARQDKKPITVFCIIGDGESQEGQIWEASMYAAQMRLDNLIVFLDDNGLQIDGFLKDINRLESCADKWRAFGWDVQTVDGHDMPALYEAIQNAKERHGKPSMIVMKTIKGNGWARIANTPESHSLNVTPEDVAEVIREADAEETK